MKMIFNICNWQLAIEVQIGLGKGILGPSKGESDFASTFVVVV